MHVDTKKPTTKVTKQKLTHIKTKPKIIAY